MFTRPPPSRDRSRSAHDRRARPAQRVRRGWGAAEAAATATTSPSGSRRTSPTASPPPRTSSTTSPTKTGIKVKLVAVAEDQFNQILTSNAAAGKLPDVIGGLPLGQVRTLSSNKLIDTDAVGSRDRRPRPRHVQRQRPRAHRGRRRPAGRAQRVVGAAAGLPQGPLRQGRAGHPHDVRRRAGGGEGARLPRRGRLHRRQRRGRRVHRADLRGDRPGQRLPARRRRAARSPSTAPSASAALDFYGTAAAGLLGRPAPRTSTPRGRRTSPARARC